MPTLSRFAPFCALALALPALAQTTLHDTLVKHWKVTEDFTIAVAQKMPADGYGFKPVPEELSFGQLMVQIAGANLNACKMASGMSGPAVPEKLAAALKDEKLGIDKDTAVQFLTDTFDFCNKAVASMTPEKLDAVVGTTRKMTGYEWLWSYFTHTAHHRGQAEVYLRVKGITPPTYVF
ncbi:DinB family protein [Candidatus Sulfopaludibacter sp. SbA3]|nr:DinB family protein [Candidatus Sulfopaludibacter sp. SbA3]